MKNIFVEVRENLEIAYQKSPFWRDFFEGRGIDVFKINSMEEYTNSIPIMDRPLLMKVIEEGIQRGFGYYFLSSTEKICAVGVTGGTTFTPLIAIYANDFWTRMAEKAVRFYKEQLQLEKKDKVGILYDLGLQPAAQFHINALRKAGFPVFPLGTSYPIDRIIKLLIDLKLTILFTTPQIASLIIERARKNRIPSSLFNIKKIMTSSSKLSPVVREDLEEFWNAEVFQVSGATELILFATECKYKSGLHLDMEDNLFEFVDCMLSTKERNESNLKSIIVTTLKNRGFHLFRYRLGDVVKVNFSDCQCGNSSPRICFIGRECLSWNLRSGIKVYDWQIQSALSTLKEFTGNYTLKHKIQEDADILDFKIETRSSNKDLEKEAKKNLENIFWEFSDNVEKGLIRVNVSINSSQKEEER